MKSHHLLLLLSVPFVFILFFLKWQDHLPAPQLTIELPNSIQIEWNKSHFFLSRLPLSNEQFRQFVLDTGYQTWRERHEIFPTWEKASPYDSRSSWDRDPNSPVMWLSQEDALRYCFWLSQHFSGLVFTLPKVEELNRATNHHFLNEELWYWTRQTYKDFDSSFHGGEHYLTAWHVSKPLQHRREKDFALSEHSPVVTILWND